MKFSSIKQYLVLPKQEKKRMKLFTIFMLGLCLSSSANSFSQQITLKERNAPISKVLEKIQQQSGYSFWYEDNLLKNAKPVNISVQGAALKPVLDLVFLGQSIGYKIIGKTIALNYLPIETPDEAVVFKPIAAPVITVSGKVTDVNGNPIWPVSVVVPGTKLGDMTDEQGNYSISNVPENATLLFSYIGYESETVPINNRSVINVVLKVEQKQLDETVVIAYGTTTKRKSTGSVSSVAAETIAKQPVANPLATLPGRMPGVLVAQNNGIPGSAVQIQIRGQNSLSQGGIPLYVIDGVPFTNFNGGSPPNDNLNAFGVSGAGGGVSPFGLINPADIERIDVLKDADATSIYGSRAANGVILITTKRGKAGKTRVDLNFYKGVSKVNRFIPVLNLHEYLQMRREAFANDNVTPTVANAPDLTVWDTTAATDWQREFLGGTGHSKDVQASISGGTEGTRFLFNTSYRQESTIFKSDDDYKRFSTRLNLEHFSGNKKFYSAINVSYAKDNSFFNSSDMASIYNLPPNLPLKDAKTDNLFFATGFTNPLTTLMKKYYAKTSNFIGNVVFRYTLFPGLNLKTNIGYTASDLDNRTTNPSSANNPANNPTSSATFSYNKASNYIVEPLAEYFFKLSEGKMTLLAGASWQHNTSNSKYFSGTNYSNEALLGSLTAAGTVTVNYDNIVEYKYAAAFARLNYDWKGKYVLNVNFRRDGSSRFGPQNRFGNFGSIGGMWVFTEEDFIKNALAFLSFGKLRGSYGTTGNDQIPNYTYLSLYNPTTAYLGNAAITPGQLPNPAIQWETTNKFEVGLELGFLKDKIYLITNYYRNRSGNQISYLSLPYQSGYNSFTTNLPALIQNSGLEIDLSSTNVKNELFTWQTSLNVTFPKNKLISWPGLENSFYSTSYIIGQPINLVRLYHYLGVDPATGKARYKDLNGDGNITYNDDRYIAKIGTPYFGGFSNGFVVKNFQLDIFFQFFHRFGTSNIVSTRPGAMVNQNVSVLDRWRHAGDNSFFPGASTTAGAPITSSYSQFSSSDALYGDASYIKMRSANLSYTFPARFIQQLKMNNMRIFMEAQNVFTWAKNRYIFDTETTAPGGPPGLGTGTVAQVTPPLRSIVFGINCSF